MKINIDGKTQYDVLWIEGPTKADGTVWIKMNSKEPLHKLVQVFENAREIESEGSETEDRKKYVGLKLIQVKKGKDENIFMQFEQGG